MGKGETELSERVDWGLLSVFRIAFDSSGDQDTKDPRM
jgi:hypothetical protein